MNPPLKAIALELASDDLEERWKSYSGRPEATLLRLHLLRDLAAKIHAARSKPASNPANALLEKKLFAIAQSGVVSDSLEEALEAPALPSSVPAISDGWVKALSKDKLFRFDRNWELALVREADRIGWSAYELQLTVPLKAAERWHTELKERLLPEGLVLWTESALEKSHQEGLWHGSWVILMRPRGGKTDAVSHLESLARDLARNLGSSDENQTLRVKLLFAR